MCADQTRSYQDQINPHRICDMPPDDFISLRDIIKVLIKHRRPIVVATLAATIVSAAIVFSRPRFYGAEAVLQVIVADRVDERPDRDAHEANILSHLEYLKSSVVTARAAAELQKRGVDVTSLNLSRKVQVVRPPKTNLLQIRAKATNREDALLMAGVWRDEYLDVLSETSVQRAVLSVQRRMAVLQDSWLDKKSQADQMRRYAENIEPDKIVTLSKSIEEGELWKRFLDGTDVEKLKKLSDVHFKNQEMSEEYLTVKTTLMNAERESYSASYMLSFYAEAMDILRHCEDLERASNLADYEPESVKALAGNFVKLMLEIRDIFPLGQPAEVSLERGALKKIVIVFFAAFFISCMIAFIFEWLKDDKLAPAASA